MTMFKIFVPVLMVASMASAEASGFDCEAPKLPERSTSNEGVRRVQKQVRIWHRCYKAQAASGQVTADAERMRAEVDSDIVRWLENTRATSRSHAGPLGSIERERRTFLRESPRTTPILR